MSRLTCLGAVGEVIGSRYLLEAEDHTLLLECGLRQGGPDAERRNEEPLGGLSAHAGQSELISWARAFHDRPVFHRVHGEPEKQAVLRDALRDRLGADARIPAFGDVIEL